MWLALNYLHCVVNCTSRNGNNTVNIIFYCLPDVLYVWLAINYQVRSFTALLATAFVSKRKPAPYDYQPSRTAVRNSLDQLARRDESFAACQTHMLYSTLAHSVKRNAVFHSSL